MTPNTARGVLPLPGKHRRSSRRAQHTQENTPCRKGSRALSQWGVCLGGPSQGPRCLGACIRAPLRVDIYSASLSKSRFKLAPITHPQHSPRCGSEPLLYAHILTHQHHVSPADPGGSQHTHLWNRHRTEKEKPQAHFPKAVFFIILVHSASYQILFYIFVSLYF